MEYAWWALVIGGLLILMALANSLLQRLPLSLAMIYLAVGYWLGPDHWRLLLPDPFGGTRFLEKLVEVALLVSLFSAGLKLRLRLADHNWRLSLRLALITMVVTIALITAAGIQLGLPFAGALLLAGILAPTDPVLASDVQVEHAADRDRLRFSLTGESGLNDGVALPFVVFALGWHLNTDSYDIGRWLLLDVVWSCVAGLAIGALLGHSIGRLVLHLRTEQKEAVGLDEFLVLGLIALTYGIALVCRASPFLAVFAAGLALCRTTTSTPLKLPAAELDELGELATDPRHAGPLMMLAVRGFNEQLERIAEVAVVILVGAMLSLVTIDWSAIALIALLFGIVRPLAVNLALIGARIEPIQRWLISWFGIRGIGSIYYLLYAINQGIDAALATTLLNITLLAVAASIVLHGISVTPLMTLYARRKKT